MSIFKAFEWLCDAVGLTLTFCALLLFILGGNLCGPKGRKFINQTIDDIVNGTNRT